TQSNYELGYAFKFMRMLCLILISFLNYWGLILGIVIGIVLISTNKTVLTSKSYLYPLIPFNYKKLKSLLFRVKKK
ncbi:MAG: spore germination protein, partial [Clostridia bacterium]|nr:spore germination protein [Clostridia bacterium]